MGTIPTSLASPGSERTQEAPSLGAQRALIAYAILGVFELTESVCPAHQDQAQGSQAWSLSPVLTLKRPEGWGSGALCRGCWGRECRCADSGQRKRDAKKLFLSQEAG